MMPKLDLPIFEIEQRLLDALKTQKRLVLTAPPVQASQPKVPQMLLDSGFLGPVK
jgi:HrpA-like RNA helicase